MASVQADEITPAWQSYLDLDADVKPYLQEPSSSLTSDVVLRTGVDMACTWVQNYLGRPVAPTTFQRKFNGWTGRTGAYLSLPYYPVLEIVEIVETWGLNGQHTLVYQTAANQGGPGDEMYQMDWLRGTVIRTFQGLIQRPWFPGSLNVQVNWVAGYNPVPPDIRMATLMLVKEWWDTQQQASRSAPKPAGQYEMAPMTGMFAGVMGDVVPLLAPYSQQGIG